MFIHVLHELAKLVLIHSLFLIVVIFHEIKQKFFIFEPGFSFGFDGIVQQTHHVSQQLQLDLLIDVIVEAKSPIDFFGR